MQNFALPNAQYLVINFFGVFRVTITAKPMKRKDRTAEKATADPQAVQRGRLRTAAPFGLVFRVVLVAFFAACAWLRRPSAKREGLWCGDSRTTMPKSRTCLCQAHAMVPNG